MPLELSDTELAIAAIACRAMAYQEGERAKNLENPTMRGPLESNSKRYAALAVKLEAAQAAYCPCSLTLAARVSHIPIVP